MSLFPAGPQPFWLISGALTLLGALLGSFAATLVLRVPAGDWATRGRSRCDTCGHRLTAFELLPILSVLWLKGRCRICKARIAPLHSGIEAACAVAGLVLGLAFPPAQAISLLLMVVQLIVLALLDLRHYWLPDRLTGVLAASGLALGGIATHSTLADRIGGMLLGYALLQGLRLLYRQLRGHEGMGGGDSKFAGAILAWLGWQAFAFLFLAASLIGLAWGLGVHKFQPSARLALVRIPFGTAMALAALCVLCARETSPPAMVGNGEPPSIFFQP